MYDACTVHLLVDVFTERDDLAKICPVRELHSVFVLMFADIPVDKRVIFDTAIAHPVVQAIDS